MGTKNVGHTLSGPSCMYEGCAITPSRIVERIIDNQDEDRIFFKYDFLALFMKTMVEIKKDGTCETNFLECLGENIDVEDVNCCKYICDMIKISKDGWQRDNMPRYFNGALTILVMIYADRTVCGDINSIRTMNPLSFWTKDMLSRRQKYEIKNGGFRKGVLREGYVEDKVANKMDEMVEDGRENDVGDIGGKGYKKMAENEDICDGENQSVSFEEDMGLIQRLMDDTLRTKALLVKKLDEACSKYPKNENVIEFVRQYDKVFRVEHKMADLIISVGTVDGNDKDKVDTVTGDVSMDETWNAVRDKSCDAMRVDGLMKNDTFKMEGAGKLADALADAVKGVVKGQVKGKSHSKKEVDYLIPSFMLLSQSSQSSPDQIQKLNQACVRLLKVKKD
ncbi:hypothetical protein Hanom_Chr11g01006341 [Helianthus anomalus]